MQIEFIGAPVSTIDEKIQDLIENSTKISLAIAYLQKSGVKKVVDYIEESKKNNTSIFVITSLNYGFTNPEALRDLIKLDIPCNIIHGENFHPKLYIFEKNDEDITIIIGYSNLSEGGLSTNYEANIILTGNISDLPIISAIEYFSYLKTKSIPIDKRIIELYCETKKFLELNDEIDKSNNYDLNNYLENLKSKTAINYKELMEKAQKQSEIGLNFYEIGDLKNALNFLRESNTIYNELISIDALSDKSDCIIGKIANLINMSWILLQLKELDEARIYADKAEVLSRSIDNQNYILDALAVVALTRGDKETKEMNKKCDKFIKIYESNKDNVDFEDYGIIGQIYSLSAECKLILKIRINDAYKQSYNSINYLEKALESTKSNFNSMITHCNIVKPIYIQNQIKPEPDFDDNIIQKHLEKALNIAKDDLKSEFWEAAIR